MLYGHFASQSVIMNEQQGGVLCHSLCITPVAVLDLLYPCIRGHFILFVSTFCGAKSFSM